MPSLSCSSVLCRASKLSSQILLSGTPRCTHPLTHRSRRADAGYTEHYHPSGHECSWTAWLNSLTGVCSAQAMEMIGQQQEQIEELQDTLQEVKSVYKLQLNQVVAELESYKGSAKNIH